MQFYAINQKTYSDTTRLCFSPIYNSRPEFYQSIDFENKENILTREELNKTLTTKKIKQLNYLNFEMKESYRGNLAFFGIAYIFSCFVFSMFGPKGLPDPFKKKIDFCSKSFYLYDTLQNKYLDVVLKAPCELQENRRGGTYLMVILLGFTAFTIFFTSLVHIIIFFYKRHCYNTSASSFNENLERLSQKLSVVNDLKVEVNAKDIGLIFPYLQDEQLGLLKFSQLKRANKYFERVFKQKLDNSLLSKQQLKIWRLFEQLKKADHELQTKMISKPLYQTIIGSDPLFFQMVIRHISPISIDDKKVIWLTDILKNQILNSETSSLFLDKHLISIIMEVASGKKLRGVIENHIKHIKGFITPSLQDEFDFFLETGELNIHHIHDCYRFLKLVISHNNDEVAKWIEDYLIEKMDQFLEDFDLSTLLDELDDLKIKSLKLKIDEYLEKNWGSLETLKNFLSDEFEMKYLFAKKYELVCLAKCLKTYFIQSVQEFTFDQPFDPNQARNTIGKILDKCENLFGDEKKIIMEHFEIRIVELLLNETEISKELTDSAKKEGNHWLKELIERLYNKNPELFSSYLLSSSPTDLLEVI